MAACAVLLLCVGVVLNHPGANAYGAAFLAPQTRGPTVSRRDAVLAAAGLAGIPAAAAAVPPFMVPGLMDAVEDKVRKAQVAQGPPPAKPGGNTGVLLLREAFDNPEFKPEGGLDGWLERTLTEDFQATMPGGQKLDKQTFISATKDILKSTPALYTRTAAISFKDNPLKVGWAADVGGQPAKITANFAKGSGLKKVTSFVFEATGSVAGPLEAYQKAR